MANQISKVYCIKDYLNAFYWDAKINTDIIDIVPLIDETLFN